VPCLLNAKMIEQKYNLTRILTAITSYGYKNFKLLEKVIRQYRNMPFNIDIVVLSDNLKNLGDNVETIAGLPTRDKWSLPFAHKKVFAERAHLYDIFIYSEDDIGVTERNISAFLKAGKFLNEDEIAGYLRFEIGEKNKRFITDIHGAYHWNPGSVKKRSDKIIAELTNQHSAFYVLTQAQLKKALASGGFLKEPYEGRYDLACTAATDPYTSCGFKRVICITEIDDFLIHHMSNRYAGKVGIEFDEFKTQIDVLIQISAGEHPATTLCNTETKILHGKWSKSYYEKPIPELLKLIPENINCVLSIGCGWGEFEKRLREKGADVVGLPLDSVIGAMAASRSVKIVYGSLLESFNSLKENKFDLIIMTNLIHLVQDATIVLKEIRKSLCKGGSLLLAGPNFDFFPHLLKRILKIGDFGKLNSYSESGISTVAVSKIKETLKILGFSVTNIKLFNSLLPQGINKVTPDRVAIYWSRDWVMHAVLNKSIAERHEKNVNN
jgi:2-polyprenyl-3-methyl-5-hydroxy-6-metoxy-1,4-benzoquinol methylase